MKTVLRNGLLSGLAGGVALATFMLLFGRGPIQDALDYEEELAHEVEGAGHAHEELFSAGVQELGGAIGLIVFGVAFGLIFAIVLTALAPKLGSITPMTAALRVGAVGFIAIVVVPFLKYPANPPAVGDPDTINERTILYFLVLGVSVVAAYVVWQVVQQANQPDVAKAWLGAGLYAMTIAVIFLVLPGPVDSVDAPADLVWNFRLASVGGLAVLWATMALTMGTLLTSRSVRPRAMESVH